jgi:uncharacterized membrane protein HdeD (DUF308 family)
MDTIFELPILKSIGLLVIIILGVFIGTHEVAEFFLKEKKHRKFWLKVWLVVSGIIGLAFWLILLLWGNDKFSGN